VRHARDAPGNGTLLDHQVAFLRQPGRIQQFDAHQRLTGTARLQDPEAALSDEKECGRLKEKLRG